jgi:signal transduction histidine kinase
LVGSALPRDSLLISLVAGAARARSAAPPGARSISARAAAYYGPAMSLHDFHGIQARLSAIADPVGFLTNLFAHAPVGFAVWSADGQALLTNKAFMDIFLVEPPPEYNVLQDELLAKNGMLPLFQQAFRGETVHVPTYWYDPREHTSFQISEGRRVAISMTIFPLFGKSGEIQYVAATYKDETEIMEAHESLRRSERQAAEAELLRREKEAAEAANRELEAFSYSVAHDLRGPLRGIGGLSEALLEDHGRQLDAGGRELLERIIGSATRMGELIDALLALARLSRAEVQHERIDLSETARGILEQLRAGDPGRSVEFVATDGAVALGDPRLLRAVLENLLGNAWKFTRKQQHARIEFECTPLPEVVRYCVRDNGIGFDMADAERLFAPFQRLHPVSEFEGAGVGLATVQRIIERHGGRVWAEGTHNQGAVFYFTLPPGKAQRSGAPPAHS